MAVVEMVPEEEAVGKVKEIYGEIKSQLGIDFVPKSLQSDGAEARVPRSELEQDQCGDGS